MMRIVAWLILLLPGAAAGIGIKLLRDTFFGITTDPFTTLWVQFVVGLLAVVLGLSFIGGFIFYRDRKRNYIQPRFKQK